MAIIKRRRADNFAMVPNAIWNRQWRTNAAGETEDLSFEAKALLAYLLGRPNNWRVEVNHLRSVTGFGRDKVYRLVSELIDFGYARREQERDRDDGKLGEYQVTIYDEPLPGNQESANETPLPENQEAAAPEPVPENQEAGPSRFLISPLPVNQEADKEREYNNTPP